MQVTIQPVFILNAGWKWPKKSVSPLGKPVMFAAAQQLQGTMGLLTTGSDRVRVSTAPCQFQPVRSRSVSATPSMSLSKPREIFIQGLTQDGRTFRPSDWSERLAGAMSCFRPGGGKGGIGAFIGYSPYCVPRVINGVKCVIVNEALKEIEPMAWEFVMNFARDNGLQVTEACLLPDSPSAKP